MFSCFISNQFPFSTPLQKKKNQHPGGVFFSPCSKSSAFSAAPSLLLSTALINGAIVSAQRMFSQRTQRNARVKGCALFPGWKLVCDGGRVMASDAELHRRRPGRHPCMLMCQARSALIYLLLYESVPLLPANKYQSANSQKACESSEKKSAEMVFPMESVFQTFP